MGVDLTLLPFLCDGPSSHTMLHLGRRSDLWPEIKAIEARSGRDVPENFMCFFARRPDGETEFGVLTEDCYGQPLRYVLAEHLTPLHDRPGVQDNSDNRAAWAYLSELPPDTKVALYWH